MTVVITHFTKA